MELTFDEEYDDKFPNCSERIDFDGRRCRNPQCGALAVHYFIPKLLGLPYKDEEKKYENLYIQQMGIQRWTKSTLPGSPTSIRKRMIQNMENDVYYWYVKGNDDWWRENISFIQTLKNQELDQLMMEPRSVLLPAWIEIDGASPSAHEPGKDMEIFKKTIKAMKKKQLLKKYNRWETLDPKATPHVKSKRKKSKRKKSKRKKSKRKKTK